MLKIGIICPSEIALRRFLPSLEKIKDFHFIGVAYASMNEWENANDEIINREKEKATVFTKQFGGKLFDSYTSLVQSSDADAIYLPLPPSLHYTWAKKALEAGKHVLLEKPSTTSFHHTNELVNIARTKGLALHENYMFKFHSQIDAINEIVKQGEIGDVRLYRISFGFPQRPLNDFRYIKKLGGGAILDCGGYTIKYASMLLGESAKIVYAKTNYIDGFEVDMHGSAALVNDQGVTAQVSFGMDNSYKCDLEVWGSKGCLTSGRVLTAPAGYTPEVTIKIGNDIEVRKFPSDDAFLKSILHFKHCVDSVSVQNETYKEILKQADYIQEIVNIQNIKLNE